MGGAPVGIEPAHIYSVDAPDIRVLFLSSDRFGLDPVENLFP